MLNPDRHCRGVKKAMDGQMISKIAGYAFNDKDRCRPTDLFPAVGSFITSEEIKKCFGYFYEAKLKRRWDCINKACLAIRELSNEERGQLVLHIGSCFVLSEKTASSYGYAYNPPLEIHAWAFSSKQGVVYDLALPGVVLSGLSMSDEIGPYLQDVEPVVIAERVVDMPQWVRYVAYETKNMSNTVSYI